MSGIRIDWGFIAALGLIVAVPLISMHLPFDGRLTSSVLGGFAAWGLAYRFFAHFHETQGVGRVAVLLLFATIVLSAIGSYQLSGKAPHTWVLYPIIGHRVACILFAIYYPRWLGTHLIFRKA